MNDESNLLLGKGRAMAAEVFAGHVTFEPISHPQEMDEPAFCLADWINIYRLPADGENESKDCLWTAECEQIVPGVRYYPDGSGEPDFIEPTTIIEGVSFEAAVARSIITHSQSLTDSFNQEKMEQAMHETPMEDTLDPSIDVE